MNSKKQEEVLDILYALVCTVQNSDSGGCVFCFGSGKESAFDGYCTEKYDCHEVDCEWVAGRKIVEEFTPGRFMY